MDSSKKKKKDVKGKDEEKKDKVKDEGGMAAVEPVKKGPLTLTIKQTQDGIKAKGQTKKKKSLHGIALLRAQRLEKKSQMLLEQKKSELAAAKALALAEEEAEEEEEAGPYIKPLLEISDSELTPKEIIEKDIIMHDMLMAHEALMEAAAEEEEEPEVPEYEEIHLEVEEEPEEEAEEEEEEVEEVIEEPIERESNLDQNEADNMMSLIGEDEDVEDDELKLLFMDNAVLAAAAATEQEAESVSNYPGVVGIDLSNETLEFFELQNLMDKEPGHTYISFKRVKLHIFIYGEASEFTQYQELFKNYPDYTMLLGVDYNKSTGHTYYLCTTIEARNLVLNPPKKKRQVVIDIKKKEEEAWAKMSSIEPRKWRSLGSELEVDEENVHNSRPLMTVFAYRFREHFNRPTQFSNWNTDKNPNVFVGFDSKETGSTPTIEALEVDAAVQVVQQKTTSSSQTGFSFKRNKMVQYENQFLEPDVVQKMLDVPVESIAKKTKVLQRALVQNEMMNLTLDDYKKLKAVKGHEVEYNNESILLQEYQTYCDARHSKNRCVTKLIFHPTIEDVVVASICEDATFDARIDLHSKTLMDPNFVLFWDLKDPIHPQLMLDAPSDVFSFQVNPSDPQYMCGGCANGQVVLWDLGNLYTELKSRIQDRRRKTKETEKVQISFLDKLKDKAEKYACPLVPAVALSNLDQSHKKVVTSVCWLPSHVELGKNGTFYENSMGGKSVQFFSSAADGTILLWDIRPPKVGLEEYDIDTSKDIIKVNPWVHLQNNMWKYTAKYLLDDGSGTMYTSIISPSEPNKGDTITMDLLHRASDATSSSGEIGASPHTSKDLLEKDSSGSGSVVGGLRSTKSKKSDIGGMNVKSEMVIGPTESETDGGVDVEAISAASRRAAGMLIVSNSLTSLFVGTETGQIALVDWLRNKDGSINPDSTGTKVCENMYLDTAHDGAITSISRSPFYNNLILVVGGGTISIWKENSGHPLLATGGSEYFPWCGCFSNTRPAVFFIGTREGALQVWDLTEKSQGPVLVQQISPGRLTACALPKAGLGKKQFLALGDSIGNVFAMLLPRFYYKPTAQENSMMLELMSREEKRLINWTNDAETREKKIEAIHTAWRESRKSTNEDEQKTQELKLEDRLQVEYEAFLEFETKLVGRLKSHEPTLAFEETNVYEEFESLVKAAREREAELKAKGELVESTSAISIGSDNDFY